MRRRLVEHLLSVLVVSAVILAVLSIVARQEATRQAEHRRDLDPYLQIPAVDLSDPLHRILLREVLGEFYPGRDAANDSLVRAVEEYRQERFTQAMYKTGGEERGLTTRKLQSLAGMYLQFILVYVIVMLITYRAAQSLAVFRFVRAQQGRSSYLARMVAVLHAGRGHPLRRLMQAVVLSCKAAGKGVAYAVLFAPAYVIAYSLRSGVDTDSLPFMILLGIVSNGLLIGAANRFFAFLNAENRKGYVKTAVVKNLDASYEWGKGKGKGIRRAVLLRPMKQMPQHVFRHIFLNAHYQYIPVMKEHASFLVTGLIIIEMALNIQGHLGYELLRTILYRQYPVTLAIVLGIFLLIKATDIAVDLWFDHTSRRYENP